MTNYIVQKWVQLKWTLLVYDWMQCVCFSTETNKIKTIAIYQGNVHSGHLNTHTIESRNMHTRIVEPSTVRNSYIFLLLHLWYLVDDELTKLSKAKPKEMALVSVWCVTKNGNNDEKQHTENHVNEKNERRTK